MRKPKVYDHCTRKIEKEFAKLTGDPEKDYVIKRRIVKKSVNCVLSSISVDSEDEEEM